MALHRQHDTAQIIKCKNIKILKDVRMTMLKCTGTRCSICRKKNSDDGMRIRSSMKAKARDGHVTIIR